MLDQKGFDLWANGYDKAVGLSDEENSYPFAGYKEALASIFQTVMGKKNAVILDIGFGTATLTTKLYEQGCNVFGQDFSAKMIDLAAAKMPDAHLNQGDFSKSLATPLLQQSYDFILATYSLHHLTDRQKVDFLGVLKGLLKAEGSILIGDVAFENRRELNLCRKKAGDGWDDDEFYFVADEMQEAFPEMNFKKLSFCTGILSIPKNSCLQGGRQEP